MGKALEITKEIVVASVSSSSVLLNKHGGNDIAEFLQAVYDKVKELSSRDD